MLARSIQIACLQLLFAGSPHYTFAQELLPPVVFVPGFAGSRLIDNQGLLWGDLRSFARRFKDLELPSNPAETTARPDGILRSVGVLGPFTIAQYDGLMTTLKEYGYVEGTNLFTFAYDWRQSNFHTAQGLRQFISATPQLRGNSATPSA